MKNYLKASAPRGTGLKSMLPKTTKAPATGPRSLEQILAENEKTRKRITELGADAPGIAKTNPSMLDRIFGILHAPASGVQSLIHNMTNNTPDVDPLKEMGKSVRGEKAMDFAHITKDAGWKPQSTPGKVAKWGVDFAGEILTDPVTWLTAGVETIVKEGASQAAKEIMEKGLSYAAAQDLSKYGVNLLGHFDEGVDILKIGQDISDKTLSRDIFKALVKRELYKSGNGKGGLQFINHLTGKRYSIVSQEALEKLPFAKEVGGFIDEAAEAIMANSPFTKHGEVLKNGGRLEFEAFRVTDKARVAAGEGGVGKAIRKAEDWKKQVPEAAHDTALVILEESMPQEVRAGIKAQETAAKKIAKRLTKVTDKLKGYAGIKVPKASKVAEEVAEEAAPKEATAAAKAVEWVKGKRGSGELPKSADGRFEIATGNGAFKYVVADLKAKNPWLPNNQYAFGDTLKEVYEMVAEKVAKEAPEAAPVVKAVKKAKVVETATSKMAAQKAALIRERDTLKATAEVVKENLKSLYATNVDWDIYEDLLRKAHPNFTDDEVARTIKAMQGTVSDFKAQWQATRDAGLKIGNRGAFYAPHRPGETSQEAVDAINAIRGTNLEPLTTDMKNGVPRGGKLNGKATAQFERKFDTIADAAIDGKPLSTYAPELIARRSAETAQSVANANAMDTFMTSFGKPFKNKMKLAADETVYDWNGSRFVIPKYLERELDTVVKPLTDDAQLASFLKIWDKGTSTWKKWATVVNPGFWMRNGQSNFYLAWAAGYGSLPHWDEAFKISFGQMKDTDLIRFKKPVPGLNGSKVSEMPLSEWREILETNGAMGGGVLQDVYKDAIKGRLGKTPLHEGGPLADLGGNMNQKVEDWARGAVFKQAYEKSGNAQIAARMTDRVMYNYSPANNTKAELALKRLFPFAQWVRSNLPAQLERLAKDPSRITIIDKMQRAGGDWMDKDILPDYIREMQPIPLPFKGKDGLPQMLNPNWGFQDINLLDPSEAGQTLISMLHPAIKLALEGSLNYDTFHMSTLKEYEGQKAAAPQWFGWVAQAFGKEPWFNDVAKKAGMYVDPETKELMVDPFFSRVLSTNPFFTNLGRALTPDDQQASRAASWLVGLKAMPYDEEKFSRSAAMEDQKQLQDFLRSLRDQGVDTKRKKPNN